MTEFSSLADFFFSDRAPVEEVVGGHGWGRINWPALTLRLWRWRFWKEVLTNSKRPGVQAGEEGRGKQRGERPWSLNETIVTSWLHDNDADAKERKKTQDDCTLGDEEGAATASVDSDDFLFPPPRAAAAWNQQIVKVKTRNRQTNSGVCALHNVQFYQSKPCSKNREGTWSRSLWLIDWQMQSQSC